MAAPNLVQIRQWGASGCGRSYDNCRALPPAATDLQTGRAARLRRSLRVGDQLISHDFPLADIVIAGDVNQLSDRDVVERTGLTQIVRQPTRGTNILDRI